MCVCACALRERENYILSQTCLPQNTSVITPNCLCPYFQVWLYDRIVSLFCLVPFCFLFCFVVGFFADAPPINQDKKVSKDNFSIIYLLRTVCKLTFSIKQMHYKTVTYLCAHVSLCPRLYMPKKVVFCAHVSLCPCPFMPKKVVFCAHVSLCPRLFMPKKVVFCAHVSLCPRLYMPKRMPVGVSGRHPLCQ